MAVVFDEGLARVQARIDLARAKKEEEKEAAKKRTPHGFAPFKVSDSLFPTSEFLVVVAMYFDGMDLSIYNIVRITHWLRDRIRGGYLGSLKKEFFIKNRNIRHLSRVASLAKNTLVSYLSQLSTFFRYLLSFEKDVKLVGDIALSHFENFLWFQCARGIVPRSCQTMVSAVRWYFEGSPSHPVFSLSIKRTLSALSKLFGRPPKKARPLTGFMLAKYAAVVDWSSLKDVRRLFIGVVAWLGMMRRSEVASLSYEIMAVDVVRKKGEKDVYLLSWELEKTKTKGKSEGDVIFIGALPAYPIIDPLNILKIYAKLCPDSPWLFPNLSNLSKPLSPASISKEIKKLVEAIGFNPKQFSGHSARRGGVTDAIKAGIPPEIIMRHGRWKSTAWYGYFEDDMYDKAGLTLSLLKGSFSEKKEQLFD